MVTGERQRVFVIQYRLGGPLAHVCLLSAENGYCTWNSVYTLMSDITVESAS